MTWKKWVSATTAAVMLLGNVAAVTAEQYDGTTPYGTDVSATINVDIDVTLDGEAMAALSVWGNTGESVKVDAQDVSLTVTNNIGEGAVTGVDVEGYAGDIEVNAGSVSVDASSERENAFGVHLYGNSGTIKLTTEDIDVKAQGSGSVDGHGVDATQRGDESKCEITLGNVTVDSTSTESEADTYGVHIGVEGDGSELNATIGDINVKTQSVDSSYSSGIQVSQYADGAKGQITVGDVTIDTTCKDSYADAYGVILDVNGNDSEMVAEIGDVTINSVGHEFSYVTGVIIEGEGNVDASVGDVTLNVKVDEDADYPISVSGVAVYNYDSDMKLAVDSITINAEAPKGAVRGILMNNGGEVYVGGDVSITAGEDLDVYSVFVRDDGEVLIDGNADGAIGAQVLGGEGNSMTIAINGTVSVEGDKAAIQLSVPAYSEDLNMEAVLNALPQVIVYELQANDLVNVIDSEYEEEGEEEEPTDEEAREAFVAELTEAMSAAIQYIIRQAADAQGKLTLSGDVNQVTVLGNTFDTATAGSVIKVKASGDVESVTADGYVVTLGADGYYTITMKVGGGLTINVKMKAPAVQNVASKVEAKEIVGFGMYDFDGDGVLDPIEWTVDRVYTRTTEISMVNTVAAPIEDLLEIAFTEDERSAISRAGLMWNETEDGSYRATVRIYNERTDVLNALVK